MNRLHPAREAWHPQSREDREVVLRELEQVLASSHFSNSKRYPALLRYVVENSLAGRTELLKERTLGVEVFQRPATYDTNSDTVVRYTAGEVRKRLLLYYSEHDSQTGIQILLPAGSYVPEFLREAAEAPEAPSEQGAVESAPAISPGSELHVASVVDGSSMSSSAAGAAVLPAPARFAGLRWRPLGVVAALLGLVALGGWWTKRPAPRADTAVQDFWAPLLHDQRTVVICAGSVVFAKDNYSGVETAGGTADYPFFSMQSTVAITQLTGLMERGGATTQLLSAPSTELTALREHSLTLLGAYNNQWTMRLTEPLRYHFSPNPVEEILDSQQPQKAWRRNESQPYSNTDDYALVARFRDSRIDGWIVALAGVGRNGTEGAAQFATSEHYLELLQQRLGSRFGNRNVEAVLKVGVVKGETGAPMILEAYAW